MVSSLRNLLFCLLLGCGGLQPPPRPTLEPLPEGSVMKYVLPDGRCSAVAVQPRLAATAGHCTGSGFGVLADKYVVVHQVAAIDADIAWLVTDSDMPVVSEPALQPPQPGELVWTAGYGCSGELEVRPAAWTGISHTDSPGAFQIAGRVCHGDSGGALWDQQGRLIGVLVAKHRSTLPIAWAVPLVFAPEL